VAAPTYAEFRMFNRKKVDPADERLFSWPRIRTLIVGTVVALVAGLVAVNLFTYFRYGGTLFNQYFDKQEKKSPMVGKLAFDSGTKYYIGIIKGEGHSVRLGDVYYIEQAGGSLIEVSKKNVEVREPEVIDK
jgi:hypothetical protein